MDPALDGVFCFGTACHVQHVPIPNAEQLDASPGITGVYRLDLGGRGRMFHVQGVFVADSVASLLLSESTLLSYADGIARTFTDTFGRSWSNTVVTGEYQPDPRGPLPVGGGGWSLGFRCALRCLG